MGSLAGTECLCLMAAKEAISGLVERLTVLYPPQVMPLQTWLQMVRVCSRLQRKLEQLLSSHDITLAQFEILMTLKNCQGICQQELAQHLLVTKGNVCVLVERLEKNGWVQRKPDPQDGRAYRLTLTHQGRSVLQKVLPEHRQLIEAVFGQLSLPESQELLRLFERLERTLLSTS